jgi:hypothetical protein
MLPVLLSTTFSLDVIRTWCMGMKRRQELQTCREAKKKKVVQGTGMGKGEKGEIRAGRDMMG